MTQGQQVHKLGVEFPDADVLKLKKNVFIAYTDVAAAGSRALLGIDMRLEYHCLDLSAQCGSIKPACVRTLSLPPCDQHFAPVQVLNCKYEEFSLVIVNTMLPGSKCHYVANQIVDLIDESSVENVTVLSVLRLDLNPSLSPMAALYENFFNQESAVRTYPSLPDDTLIPDPFFNTLLQMLIISCVPLRCLLVPGNKVCCGLPRPHDGSLQAIDKFQDVLAERTHLRFSKELSHSLYFKGSEDDIPAGIAAIYF